MQACMHANILTPHAYAPTRFRFVPCILGISCHACYATLHAVQNRCHQVVHFLWRAYRALEDLAKPFSCPSCKGTLHVHLTPSMNTMTTFFLLILTSVPSQEAPLQRPARNSPGRRPGKPACTYLDAPGRKHCTHWYPTSRYVCKFVYLLIYIYIYIHIYIYTYMYSHTPT
jgi:hypothetical protein